MERGVNLKFTPLSIASKLLCLRVAVTGGAMFPAPFLEQETSEPGSRVLSDRNEQSS